MGYFGEEGRTLEEGLAAIERVLTTPFFELFVRAASLSEGRDIAHWREVFIFKTSETSIREDRKGSELARIGYEIDGLNGLVESVSVRH